MGGQFIKETFSKYTQEYMTNSLITKVAITVLGYSTG